MKKYMTLLILFIKYAFSDCEPMYGQYYSYNGNFDFEEYVFGENNCCEEYFYPCVGMIECILLKRIMLTLLILKTGT